MQALKTRWKILTDVYVTYPSQMQDDIPKAHLYSLGATELSEDAVKLRLFKLVWKAGHDTGDLKNTLLYFYDLAFEDSACGGLELTAAAWGMFSSGSHRDNISEWPDYELGEGLQTVKDLVAVVGEQSAFLFECCLVMSLLQA